jgi:hypothetical protein
MGDPAVDFRKGNVPAAGTGFKWGASERVRQAYSPSVQALGQTLREWVLPHPPFNAIKP